MHFKRILQINTPPKQSIFLWGARQTGKSAFLKEHFPESIYYDLLLNHEIIRLSKNPQILREEVLALPTKKLQHPIIIDEIQKIPSLLNEVHWLIENSESYFILCGSSARKLKQEGINLLGGRAWPYYFFPLCYPEIPNFDLLQALQHGMVPNHYGADNSFIDDYLQAYVDIYLTEEIRNEGLVRNLAAFSRFLDVAGLSNGEMINASNIARDCGIDRNTVQAYYQILIDTLIGYFIYPFKRKISRDIIVATPKFYFFDVGVANYLNRNYVKELAGTIAGRSFEHFIFMELTAFNKIFKKRKDICYWRTKTGLEVDFIIGDAECAIEVKISNQVKKSDLKGLIAFCEEHKTTKAIVVSQDPRKRQLEISNNCIMTIMPWGEFLQALWDGMIF